MPKTEKQKVKLLYIAKYLMDYTDVNHTVFGMYGGDYKRVSMRFTNDLLDTVYDKIGIAADVFYRKDDARHFEVTADVEISPVFFGWLCGFGNKALITSPKDVKKAYSKWLSDISTMY